MSDTENAVHLEKYELMLIFFSDLGQEAINKELDEIRQHLKSNEGDIFHEDIWGARDLSYTIKKQREGFYVVLNFTYPPEKISEMEKGLNINPSVVRYLLLKTPINYAIKTLSEYQEEEEKLAKEEETKKAESKNDKMAVTPKKPEVVQAKKEVKEVKEVKKEEVEEKKPVKTVKVEEVEEEAEKPVKKPKKEAKSSLDEFDEKLKSIIDDPDIKL